MAVGLVGGGDEDEAAFLYLFDFLLGEAESGGIDEVVGGIHEHNGNGNASPSGWRDRNFATN